MKIAITSMGQELTAGHDPRFGRCAYFLIYDTEEDTYKAVENKGQLAGGGAGIAAAQQMTDEGVQVVLTGNLGPNAYNLIKASGIKAYQCKVASCQDALALYKAGKLLEISQAGPSHAGMS
ncbi:MAG: NifB/NifX family molybdenum-iron cluster-binding protein [Desulfitobacteriia bacterium]|jgi:predicted Fe-Mo cluster-binding NifX family protein